MSPDLLKSPLTLDEIELLLDCMDHQESCYLSKKEAIAESALGINTPFSSLFMPKEVQEGMKEHLAEKREAFLKDLALEKERLTLLKAKLILLKGSTLAADVERDLGTPAA